MSSENSVKIATLVTSFDAEYSGMDRSIAHVEASTLRMINGIERQMSQMVGNVVKPFDAMSVNASKEFQQIGAAATKAAEVVEIAANKIRDAKGRFASAAALPMAQSLAGMKMAMALPGAMDVMNSLPMAKMLADVVTAKRAPMQARGIAASVVQAIGAANGTLQTAGVIPRASGLPSWNSMTGYGGFAGYVPKAGIPGFAGFMGSAPGTNVGNGAYGGYGGFTNMGSGRNGGMSNFLTAAPGTNASGNLTTGFGGFGHMMNVGRNGGMSNFLTSAPGMVGVGNITSGYGGFGNYLPKSGSSGFAGFMGAAPGMIGSGSAGGYGHFDGSGNRRGGGGGAGGFAGFMSAAPGMNGGGGGGYGGFSNYLPPPGAPPPDYTVNGGGDFWRGRGGAGGGGGGGMFGPAMEGLAQFDNRAREVAERFRGYGNQMSMAFTVPLTLIGKASVNEFSKFDDAMTRAFAHMDGDKSPAMRGALADKAKSLSANGIIAPDQVAQAYIHLASAGYEAERALAALPVVEKFATAGAFEMAHATRYLVDAQAALGLSTKDEIKNMENMTRVGDVLVKANMLSNATTEEFSEALTNKAGAALRLLNKDVEEGVAVLAAYAEQGVKGMIAGEKLNIILRDLQTSSIKNKSAWQEMGLSVYDASGNMLGIAPIIKQLEGAFSGLSDEQIRTSLMTLGFQDRSVAAIATLLGTSDAITRYEAELRKAGGTMNMVAEEILTSFASQMKNLWNNIKLMAIEIGENLAPSIASLNGVLRDGLEYWNSLEVSTKRMVVEFGLFLAVAGPVMALLSRSYLFISTLVREFSALVMWIGTMAFRVPAAITAIMGFAAVHPVIAGIVIGVTALVAGIELLSTWLGKDLWGGFLEGVSASIEGMGVFLKLLVAPQAAAEAFAPKGSTAPKPGSTVWELNSAGELVERNADYVPTMPDYPHVERSWQTPGALADAAFEASSEMYQFGNGALNPAGIAPTVPSFADTEMEHLPGEFNAEQFEESLLAQEEEKMGWIVRLMEKYPELYSWEDKDRLMEEEVQSLENRFRGPTMVTPDNDILRPDVQRVDATDDSKQFERSKKLGEAQGKYSADAYSTMIKASMERGGLQLAGGVAAVTQANAGQIAAATARLQLDQALKQSTYLQQIRDKTVNDSPDVITA